MVLMINSLLHQVYYPPRNDKERLSEWMSDLGRCCCRSPGPWSKMKDIDFRPIRQRNRELTSFQHILTGRVRGRAFLECRHQLLLRKTYRKLNKKHSVRHYTSLRRAMFGHVTILSIVKSNISSTNFEPDFSLLISKVPPPPQCSLHSGC